MGLSYIDAGTARLLQSATWFDPEYCSPIWSNITDQEMMSVSLLRISYSFSAKLPSLWSWLGRRDRVEIDHEILVPVRSIIRCTKSYLYISPKCNIQAQNVLYLPRWLICQSRFVSDPRERCSSAIRLQGLRLRSEEMLWFSVLFQIICTSPIDILPQVVVLYSVRIMHSSL